MEQETRERLERIERKINTIGHRVYQKTTFERLFETNFKNAVKIVLATVLVMHLLRGGDLKTFAEIVLKLL